MLLQWSRSARIALLSSAAVACTLVGMLLGVLAAGSHVSEVLRSIESPAAAFARAHKPPTNATIAQSHTVVRTQTRTVTQPGSTVTVTQPAQTVTVTEATPPTTTPPTTTPTSTSPPGAG